MSKVYVFDLDETLIEGDSAVLWHHYLVDNGIIKDPDFLEKDRAMMDLYDAGKLNMQGFLDFAIPALSHISADELRAHAREYAKKQMIPRLYPEARQLLDKLKQDNIPHMVISATVDYLVEAVAEVFGVETSFGIKLYEKEGRLTPEVDGISTFREGKVECFEAWLAQHPQYQGHEVHFFSDSINDLALCERADVAYAVNPCPQLQAVASERDWQVIRWQR